MFTNILVPLDGTDLAEGILPYVARIAGGVGARLTLLMVVDPYALAVPDSLRGDLSGRAVPARSANRPASTPTRRAARSSSRYWRTWSVAPRPICARSPQDWKSGAYRPASG